MTIAIPIIFLVLSSAFLIWLWFSYLEHKHNLGGFRDFQELNGQLNNMMDEIHANQGVPVPPRPVPRQRPRAPRGHAGQIQQPQQNQDELLLHELRARDSVVANAISGWHEMEIQEEYEERKEERAEAAQTLIKSMLEEDREDEGVVQNRAQAAQDAVNQMLQDAQQGINQARQQVNQARQDIDQQMNDAERRVREMVEEARRRARNV